jgi:restriction endonuclease S subunit
MNSATVFLALISWSLLSSYCKSFLLGYTNEENGIFPAENLPVIIFDDFTTATKFVDFPFKVKSSAMKILKAKENVNISYAFYMMQKLNFDASQHKRYWISQYSKIQIPLPPLEVQEQIVAEIEKYQKVIDGAKQVVENWKPSFRIDPSWEMVELGEVCEVISGQSPEGKYYNEKQEGLPFYQGKTEFQDMYVGEPQKWTSQTTKIALKGDILMSVRAPVGPVNFATQEICIGRGLASIRGNDKKINQTYLF